ncbi:hypothetical protein NPS01_22530 [Nocardioides psychrotolerans]|uniref:DNA-binding phage zinc finger domain-containing protein n=1 Tax=Nocardioides psychrotolerans TaxID=1005945 RepID=A0A1I3I5V9_9ACTN|nr:hypothetical protein [Nocardioides psychrotolerans]GEP38590.1 hypothetical protein NPS01_22530 [Nocardioides psychrotolerans]SFI43378.1 hypothetical protein SAMN05216561_108131 [Nocardioides psychrotolerans]
MSATTHDPLSAEAAVTRPSVERGAHLEAGGQEVETIVILRPTSMDAAAWQQLGQAVDHLVATDLVEVLAGLLANAARGGVDIGDLLGAACTEATRRLPRGMALTDARPGSWESDLINSLTHPDAVDEGPVATPLDVECERCWAAVGASCFNPVTYVDNKHPHRERVELARGAVFSTTYGWAGW